MAAKQKDTDYLYASARVRGLENQLMKPTQVETLLETRTHEEIVKFLGGLGYDVSGVDPELPDFYERILSRKREETLHLVADMAPAPHLFDYFLYLYDYHNLKVLLKSELLQKNFDRLLMAAGTIPVAVLLKAVRERDGAPLTSLMTEGIAAAREAYGKSQNPQMIDIVLDRFCFGDMLRCAKETGSGYVAEFVTLQIDLTNCKSFLRLKKMGAGEEFAKLVLVSGGSVPKEAWVSAFALSPAGAGEALAAYSVSGIFQQSAAVFAERGGIARVELLCDNALMDYCKSARYISFGIEPLVAYLYAVESELKSLKIIIAGKLSAMDHGKIRERLRASYV